MPFLKKTCPQCNKLAEFEKEFTICSSKIIKFKCGHYIRQEHLTATKNANEIESLDGKKLFPYQVKGVDFILNSGARCLVADEMGLGKTVQALSALAMNEKELMPFLGIVKSSLKEQWQRMSMNWIGEDCFVQVIQDKKDHFLPGMRGYIISYDMVRRFGEVGKVKKSRVTRSDITWELPDGSSLSANHATKSHAQLEALKEVTEKQESFLIQQIKKLKIKTIILDEVQQIKNVDSKRTAYVRELCKEVEHVIALSGTPIKNNALEYFPILNILRPEKYSKFSTFQMYECDTYFDGFRYKAGGLRHPKEFLEKTKDFIIRREMKDVKDELPNPQDPITRNFSFHDMGKEVAKMYEASLNEFMDEIDGYTGSFAEEGNILKYLTKMRHITGLAKIDPCLDFCMEFLGGTDRKMLIFIHHNDVGDILMSRLKSLTDELELEAPIRFNAGDDSQEFVTRFGASHARIAVVSTLAGGEGMDGLQEFCSDLVVLERQWNPANEEQAEKRVSQRIGQAFHCTGTYFVAVGTVDEFFSEIVERKREIVNKTLSGEAVEWNQSSLIRELTERLQAEGLKRWSLRK